MDANDAAIKVGAQLEEARDNGTKCARLVARDGEILLVGQAALQEGDIHIDHLSTTQLRYGMSPAKWNNIENKIRDLLLKGLL